jgi:hypothetical protein
MTSIAASLEIGPEGSLVKSELVLTLSEVNDTFAIFTYAPGEEKTSRTGTTYVMSAAEFEEFGSPEEITITIIPGNTL